MISSNKNLHNSVLITGASGAIGSALARRYAAPGVTLFLSCRDGEHLTGVAQECEQKGAKVYTRSLDVMDRVGCEEWIREADQVCPLGMLFANAGVSEGNTGCEDHERMRHIIDVNLIGVLNTVLPALSIMRKRNHGHIAVVSSIAGFRGIPMSPAYSTSKVAAKAFGEALRPYLSEENVRVTVICPGYVSSPMTDENNFAMPFMVSTEKAAETIYRGMARNKSRIVFPFPMHLAAWTLGALPPALTDWLLTRVTKKRHSMR